MELKEKQTSCNLFLNQFIKTLDKNEILLNANKAFESMEEVLMKLNPPQSSYISKAEEIFFYELNEFIEAEILNIKNIKRHLKTNVEWDQLNVAFFGETNAGKSTTIESTLSYFSIPTKGQTIGDGTKDFTKDVTYHNFKIKGKKIGLIDLPGIEGDEKGNLDDIDAILRKGITKAHLVFYVYGNNKKPEPATVKRIKKYLDEQALVLSVCNNRGKAGQYKRILKREGEVILKNSEVNNQSREILSDLLDVQYHGDIFINSLAAYLSVGNIEREDFKNDKKAFLEVFETTEKLRAFSNLKSITAIIEEKAKIVKEVILEANKKKLNHVLREVTSSLQNFEAKEISELKIEKTNSEINNFLKNIKEEIKKSETQCRNKISSNIDYHFRTLENKIIKLIDEGNSDKEKVNDIIYLTTTNLEKAIKASFKSSNQDCINRIESRLDQLERYSSLGIRDSFSNLGHVNNFELDGLSELGISIGDFGSLLLALSPFLIPGPPGWISGGVSVIGWGLSKLITGKSKTRAKAKAKISEELRIEKNQLKDKFRNEIIRNHYKSFEGKILYRLKPMQKIPDEMIEWRSKINNSKNKINKLIIK